MKDIYDYENLYISGELIIGFTFVKREENRALFDFCVSHNKEVILQGGGLDYSVPIEWDNEKIANDLMHWAYYENEEIYDYADVFEEHDFFDFNVMDLEEWERSQDVKHENFKENPSGIWGFRDGVE